MPQRGAGGFAVPMGHAAQCKVGDEMANKMGKAKAVERGVKRPLNQPSAGQFVRAGTARKASVDGAVTAPDPTPRMCLFGALWSTQSGSIITLQWLRSTRSKRSNLCANGDDLRSAKRSGRRSSKRTDAHTR